MFSRVLCEVVSTEEQSHLIVSRSTESDVGNAYKRFRECRIVAKTSLLKFFLMVFIGLHTFFDRGTPKLMTETYLMEAWSYTTSQWVSNVGTQRSPSGTLIFKCAHDEI